MSTGAKIAIGCGVAVLLAGLAVVAVMIGGAYWAKGKMEGLVAEQKQIQELQEKANANAFTVPADGVLSEPRLVTFLDVRKRVFAVYEKHKDEIEAMGKKKEADFGDVRKGINLLNELRLAQAQGQADLGMSDTEYRYMVETVYKAAWATEIEKSTGGKSLSEVTEDAMKQAAEALEKQAQATPDPSWPPEAQKAWADAQEQARKQQEELQKQTADVREESADLDVPEANKALFKKYEADIKKYAMSGLEWLGL